LVELIDISLIAAIDTTSSLLSWNIMHLAMNQDVQDKLRTELVETVAKHGGLNSQALKKSSSPYLHAVIRESHRLTPAAPITCMKENSLSEVEIHGTVVPMGSLFCMDAFSVGMDPEFVRDPKGFRPERWLPDAVESRKGTPSEIIDHGFYKDPFSQGSRKCPGSRVASNEVLIMVSQLILDWKISAPSRFKSVDDVDYMLHGMIHPKLPKLEFTSR
jgi:cytochrome P450